MIQTIDRYMHIKKGHPWCPSLFLGRRLLSVTFAELVNLASRLQHVLFAGIERMAHRADFRVDVLGCAARLERVAAAAANLHGIVFRMNIFFHKQCFLKFNRQFGS